MEKNPIESLTAVKPGGGGGGYPIAGGHSP